MSTIEYRDGSFYLDKRACNDYRTITAFTEEYWKESDEARKRRHEIRDSFMGSNPSDGAIEFINGIEEKGPFFYDADGDIWTMHIQGLIFHLVELEEALPGYLELPELEYLTSYFQALDQGLFFEQKMVSPERIKLLQRFFTTYFTYSDVETHERFKAKYPTLERLIYQTIEMKSETKEKNMTPSVPVSMKETAGVLFDAYKDATAIKVVTALETKILERIKNRIKAQGLYPEGVAEVVADRALLAFVPLVGHYLCVAYPQQIPHVEKVKLACEYAIRGNALKNIELASEYLLPLLMDLKELADTFELK